MRKALAIAFAEIRSARRLVRTWLFAGLAVVIGVGFFIFFSFMHGAGSGVSPSAGLLSPRFTASYLGVYYVWVLMTGLIFLAFDIRARDQRELIAEVVDVRPTSNLSLLAGRLAGLVIVAWVPVLVIAVIFQAIGGAAQLFDWWMGETVQPVSLIVLLFLDVLPVLIFWCAVVMLLAVALRLRLLVVIAACALLGLHIYAVDNVPTYLLGTVFPFGSQYPSDILPGYPDGTDLAHRASLLLLAAGALLAAAVLYPRPDGALNSVRIGASVACITGGAALLAMQVLNAADDVAVAEQWAAAHESRRDDPYPGVDEVKGTVRMVPGETLGLDIEMRLTSPADRPLDELLFTFNPGMQVDAVRIDGEPMAFTHADGLLAVALPRPLAAGSSAAMSLSARGVPDPAFGYLDSAINPARMKSASSALLALGSDTSLFKRRYVALMPSSGWLPRPGASFDVEDPSRRPRDFFQADLVVEGPAGWLVAGPGRREVIGDGRFRFRPAMPVPDIGLFASRFERRAIHASDVEFELLLHPRHLRNIAFFADAADALATRVQELFSAAEDSGLGYPYEALSVVEVPAQLRTYGGGWRMDTALSVPGIMLMNEAGFPTSRFELQFRDPESLAEMESAEGGIAAAKVRVLERFFANDVNGGNPFAGVPRNFLAYQTGATGVGATALDFVCAALAERLLTDDNAFFSAHLFHRAQGMEQVMATIMSRALTSRGDWTISNSVMDRVTNTPSVWNRALGAPLARLDTDTDPGQAFYTLALKGQATAKSIWDALGRERTAALLSELRHRHAGQHFTAEDFNAAALSVGADIESIVGDWLHDAALPGFLASAVEVFRLRDSDFGQSRYQIRLHVRNDEPVPGLFRIEWRSKKRLSDTSAPIRIGAAESVEIGLVAATVPSEVMLRPYLSLNRQTVRLDVPKVDVDSVVEQEPFEGSRTSDWRPRPTAGVVVDDLDPGFSDDGSAAERIAEADFADVDEGLPSFGGPGSGWFRQEAEAAWGKYRHTLARSMSSPGLSEAVSFTARLPHAGRWRLDYHLPRPKSRGRSVQAPVSVRIGSGGMDVDLGGIWNPKQGPYDMQLVADGTQSPVEFDGAAGVAGWNNLGEFELEAGEVRLVVTNKSVGQNNGPYVIVADAIRWLPVNSK